MCNPHFRDTWIIVFYSSLSSKVHYWKQFDLQVPHSQCSLKETPKFLQNFRCKNNTQREKIWLIILFNICHCNEGLSFKSKKLLHYLAKLYIFHKRKFPKLNSETQVSFVNEAPGTSWCDRFICLSFYFLLYLGAVLLGDPAYPLTSWLLTAFPGDHDRNSPKGRYNRHHLTTRCSVERAFGCLKKRFYRLGEGEYNTVNHSPLPELGFQVCLFCQGFVSLYLGFVLFNLGSH